MSITEHNIHLCLLLFKNELHMRPHITEEMLYTYMDIDVDMDIGIEIDDIDIDKQTLTLTSGANLWFKQRFQMFYFHFLKRTK